MDLIRNELDYDPNTGVIKWKRYSRGRRKDLIAGNVRTVNGYKYRRIHIGKYEITATRVAWFLYTGMLPNFIIDVIDGNALNLKWDNLRRGDGNVDRRNLKLGVRNRSGVLGVHVRNGRYYTYIGAGNRLEYLGVSSHLFEAACLRKSAERRLGYSLNHGRTN